MRTPFPFRPRPSVFPHLSQKGAALTEMGMLLGLIGVVAIGSVFATGTTVKHVLCTTTYQIQSHLPFGGDPEPCALDLAEGTPGAGGPGTGTGGGDGGGAGGPGSGGGALPDDGTPTPPGTPPGTQDGQFVDMTFPAGTVDMRYAMLGIPPGTASHMIAQSGSMSVVACFQQDAAQTPICRADSIEVPANAIAIGYGTAFPSGTARPYAGSVALQALGALPTQWTVSNQRLPAPHVIAPAIDFPDLLYPAGTHGVQRHMQPWSGTLNDEAILRISSAQHGEEAIQVCKQMTPQDAVQCSYGWTAVPPNTYAIGYSVALNTPLHQPYASEITLSMESPQVFPIPATPHLWVIQSQRPAQPNDIALSAAVATPVVLPMRTMPDTPQARITTPITASGTTGTVRVSIDSADLNLRLCLNASTHCARSHGGVDPATLTSMTLVAYPPAEAHLAYASTLTYTFTAENTGEVLATYSQDISRTIDPYQFSPSIALETLTLPAGTTGAISFFGALSGTINDTFSLTVAKDSAALGAIYPCYATTSNPTNRDGCYTSVSNLSATTTATLGWQSQIGGNLSQALDTTITWTLTPTSQPSQARTFTQRVVRPALVYTASASADLTTHAMPVGTRNGTPAASVTIPFTLTSTDPLLRIGVEPRVTDRGWNGTTNARAWLVLADGREIAIMDWATTGWLAVPQPYADIRAVRVEYQPGGDSQFRSNLYLRLFSGSNAGQTLWEGTKIVTMAP